MRTPGTLRTGKLMSTVCSGEKEGNFPQEHISNYLFMNWWTGRPPIERQEQAACHRQLHNSQLIVLLLSVKTPALQLGFGGTEPRHQVKVTLFILTGTNIYIYIHANFNLADSLDKSPRKNGFSLAKCKGTPGCRREELSILITPSIQNSLPSKSHGKSQARGFRIQE